MGRRTLRQAMGETLALWKSCFGNFHEIGMLTPSSRYLARAMIKSSFSLSGKKNILEVGPGTGPVTREIVRRLGPDDKLSICEINQELLQHLKEDLEKFSPYREKHLQISFYHCPVQELKTQYTGEKFTSIVSSLPFLRFEAHVVEEIISMYKELITPSGYISWYEYIFVRQFLELVALYRSESRIIKLGKLLNRESKKGSIRYVFANIPPAQVVNVCNSRS